MKKLSFFISAFVILLLASSCGTDTVYPQNEDGGKAVKQIIEKNFDPEKQVEELQIKSKDELYGELGTVTIVYWDVDKQIEHVYSSADGLKKPEETFGSKQKMPMLKKSKTLAIKEFDTEPIPQKVGEAAALIPSGYENFSLHEYTFSVGDDGKVQQHFTINTTKKGEGKSQNGRMVRQNYYEFAFKVDGSGKVKIIEK